MGSRLIILQMERVVLFFSTLGLCISKVAISEIIINVQISCHAVL